MLHWSWKRRTETASVGPGRRPPRVPSGPRGVHPHNGPSRYDDDANGSLSASVTVARGETRTMGGVVGTRVTRSTGRPCGLRLGYQDLCLLLAKGSGLIFFQSTNPIFKKIPHNLRMDFYPILTET